MIKISPTHSLCICLHFTNHDYLCCKIKNYNKICTCLTECRSNFIHDFLSGTKVRRVRKFLNDSSYSPKPLSYTCRIQGTRLQSQFQELSYLSELVFVPAAAAAAEHRERNNLRGQRDKTVASQWTLLRSNRPFSKINKKSTVHAHNSSVRNFSKTLIKMRHHS